MVFFRSTSLFLSVLTSLLLWLSFPGGGEFWPILFVALIPLLFVLSGVKIRSAIFCGLCCGLVHFTLLLVLDSYCPRSIWWTALVPVCTGLALACAVHEPLFCTFRLACPLYNAGISCRRFGVAAARTVGRRRLAAGLLFTGFPWMDLGYGLFEVPALLQIADLVGHYGVSFLIVLVNTCLMLIFRLIFTRKTFGCCLFPCSGASTLSAWRGGGLFNRPLCARCSRELLPRMPRELPWELFRAMLIRVLSGRRLNSRRRWTITCCRRSRSLSPSRPSLVVWPETALPFYPPSSGHMQPLRELVAGKNFALLTGAPWYEVIDPEAKKSKFF